jgi:exodeoxyribonuclease V beta subunit
MTLFNVVKQAIEKYRLFKKDFHLIRFLNAVSSYSDIEALLFEYERLDTPAAASDISGVRVLTVHKSKGLEYEHVIVMDRLKKPPASRGSIIYEYEGIELQNVYLRTKDRDAIDSAYERALAKEQKLVREDSLNAFYVAFTRAREHLVIIKKSEKSSFDLLELPLGKRGELLVNMKQKEEVTPLQPLHFQEFYYGTQSEILAQEKQKDEDLKAINFGLALHYMLEMMENFDSASIENAKDMMLNKYGFELSSAEVLDIEQRVKLFCESQEVAKIIEGKQYKEQALRYKKNLRYIDLLVEHKENSFHIIDYKSSISFGEHHVKQVRAYVNAIEEISGGSAKGFICYLLADEIKIVAV